MNKVYDDFYYRHEDGQETAYTLQEIREGDGPGRYVLSESTANQGPGFDDMRTRDAVARDVAAGIQSRDGIEPHEVNLHQQRPDGGFDRVEFRSIGRDQGMDPSAPTQWSEYHREGGYDRAGLERSLNAEIAAPSETPQMRHQRLEHDNRELSGPTDFRRDDVSKAERAELQQQVDAQQQERKHSRGF